MKITDNPLGPTLAPHMKAIEAAKNKIQQLSAEQQQIYSNLLEQLPNLEKESATADYLWDYVWNDYTATIEL